MALIFRQLIDPDTKTNTYLLGDSWSREALLIDPVMEMVERDAAIISELGLKLVYTLDTHVHADHVTGAGLLRAKLGSKVGLSGVSGAEGADIYFDDGDAVRFGLQAIEVRSTPGHTSGCVTYVTADRDMAFTGDALFIRGCGRTDFQQGSARTLYRSIRDKIFSLPDDTLVYPGHDYRGRTVSTISEEKAFNPRLGGGKSEDEFAAIMDGLKLAYPRKIDVALPANLKCGLTDDTQLPEPELIDTIPIERNAGGAPAVSPFWVAEHLADIKLIDVREADEFTSSIGHLAGAELYPMSQYLAASNDWNRKEPLVLICRSGGRSDSAAVELERHGFTQVASMTGGMLRWNHLGLPTAGDVQG